MIIAAGAVAPLVVNEATNLLIVSGAADQRSPALMSVLLLWRTLPSTRGKAEERGPQLNQHRICGRLEADNHTAIADRQQQDHIRNSVGVVLLFGL